MGEREVALTPEYLLIVKALQPPCEASIMIVNMQSPQTGFFKAC